MESKETMIYQKLPKKMVRCGICGQECELADSQTGICKVRKNLDGKLYSLVYGKAIDIAVDPIEKKPFFHFAPGSTVTSVATMGCNLSCAFCQNWEISNEFKEIKGDNYSPEDIIKKAKGWMSDGIAYTYTEPAVFYEYVYDTAKISGAGLYNVLVTNGYFSPESIKKISSHIDAANVDLKGNYSFYKKYCSGTRGDEPVKETLKTLQKSKVWVEITNMIIPGKNDKPAEIKNMCNWIVENMGTEVPVHFSRFFPNYKMTDTPITPEASLEEARNIARNTGIKYVYIGNVPGHKYESTFCNECGSVVIKRNGFEIEEFNLDRNMRCRECGKKLPIAGEKWIKEKFFRK